MQTKISVVRSRLQNMLTYFALAIVAALKNRKNELHQSHRLNELRYTNVDDDPAPRSPSSLPAPHLRLSQTTLHMPTTSRIEPPKVASSSPGASLNSDTHATIEGADSQAFQPENNEGEGSERNGTVFTDPFADCVITSVLDKEQRGDRKDSGKDVHKD